MVKGWITSFARAWELLIDIPLPYFAHSGGDDENDGLLSAKLLLIFPLIGTILGLVIYLLAWILQRFPGNPGAPVIFAIASIFALEYAVSGRNLGLLSSFLGAKFEKVDTLTALRDLDDNINTPKTPVSILILVTVFIIRLFCFALLLYYQRYFWIPVILTANFATQAHIASGVNFNSNTPIFELNEKTITNMWVLTGAVMLFFGLSCIPATVIALAFAIYFSNKFKRFCDENLGGINEIIISFAGFSVELILLLIGIAFLTQGA